MRVSPSNRISNFISQHRCCNAPTLANRKLLLPLVLGSLPLARLCSITTTGLIAAPAFHTSPAVFRRPLIDMAWRSSGGSNRDLIENMWRNQLITHPQVKEAFLKVSPPPAPSPRP